MPDIKESDFERSRTTEDGDVEIIVEKFLSLQVCTTVENADRLTLIVNDMYPCGTSAGWVLTKREEAAGPVACAEFPNERKHYVFDA